MSKLNAERHRTHHRSAGEPYRWFRGIPVPEGTAARDVNGRLYIEQTLGSAARGLFGSTTIEIEDAEFGIFRKGTTAFSVMPDESLLARLDRIVLTGRELLCVERVIRGSGATDTLSQPHMVSVTEVRQGVTTYAVATNYTIASNVVTWVLGGPTVGSEYVVTYKARPVFEFIPLTDHLPFKDRNGVYMPQRGALRLWKPSK